MATILARPFAAVATAFLMFASTMAIHVPAHAGDEAPTVVANDDSFERWSFQGKEVLSVLANDTSTTGSTLSLYDVTETDSPYGDTYVSINDKGKMVVAICACDSGLTISWTYRVQDESGQISEPALVTLRVMDTKDLKARRTDGGRKATFSNPNMFDVQIKIDWHFANFSRRFNKIFVVPAGGSETVRMHSRKRMTRYIGKALPWKDIFWIEDI